MNDVPPRAAAFFDLDKTIVARSSALAFVRPLSRAGLLPVTAVVKAAIAQLYYGVFGADRNRMEQAREALADLTRGWDRARLRDLVADALQEVVPPLVYAEALVLIDEHHRAGRLVAVISASPDEVAEPLGRYVGADRTLATRSETDEAGIFTGRIERYMFGESKAEAIRELAAAEGISLPDSYAYTDSVTDLPMLETVGHPVAVNPDRELRAIADERDWLVMEFRRPVTLRTRLADLPRPVPILGAAALAGAAAAVVTVALLRRRRTV